MLLQRYINNSNAVVRLILLGIVLTTAGCATTGDSPRQRTGAAETEDVADAGPEIPARARTMFEQAAAVLAAGDLVDAELRFKEFLLEYPQYPGGHVNLAIIHAANDDEDAARAALDAALAIDPDHSPALNQLGMLLRRNGNFLEAEAAYLKAVTATPDYALAHYNLGVLNELYLQRLDVALQHFEQYQALVGEDAQVERWIVDLRRRVAATQRTANIAE